MKRRDVLTAALLAVLPMLAHAPAWWEGRLLGPDDGAALHFPLKAWTWEAYRRGELPSWNPGIFSGTPLVASYRPGAFFPPVILLSLLDPFTAFQVLVLCSLAAAGALVFCYLRVLGAGRVAAYFSGLSFCLGPYLVGHMDDTATLTAAPLLPLVLLAAEAHMRRSTAVRAAFLTASVALLLLAGSPEAARAGAALLAGRLLVGHLLAPSGAASPSGRATALAVFAGILLAAPQLVPTLLLARDGEPWQPGLAPTSAAPLPGLTGLVLRYVSHTPAPSLALAALPLVSTRTPVRVLGIALGLCVGLQWGRGPLAAPGALALVFDLTLAILAGLSLDAQWITRRFPLGRRLRAYFLFACLASAAALSVSAATLGPLPQTLSGAVGVLALSLILYFSQAASADPVVSGIWLLPLTVSFLLQPHGRRVWEGTPRRDDLFQGTPTRQALDRAQGRASERVLTLTREWPRAEASDLGYANLGSLSGRRSANGYDPMAPVRGRAAFERMGLAGALPGAFFASDPGRLEILGLRWAQVPTSALVARGDAFGFGEALDLPIEAGRPRFIPLPITPATEVRVASSMAEAVTVADGEPVARLLVRLASGRELPLVMRAGTDTGEWAYDRPDVRAAVLHERPRILESWSGQSGGFEGHRYQTSLALPGRYYVDGIRIERLPGAGFFTLARLGLADARTGRLVPVSRAAGYVSDSARFREAATTPSVRLYELPNSPGAAHVAERLRVLADDAAVLQVLRAAARTGIDPRREALATAADVQGIALPQGTRSSRAEIVRAEGNRIDVRAEGPGLLVVAETWDPGWSAALDGGSAQVLRVNHAQIGLVIEKGTHRLELHHRSRGLTAGFVLAAVGLLAVFRRPGS